MQPLIDKKLSDSESEFHFGAVRSPIQSEGIERGHRRMAEVAVSGSVNPQTLWSDWLAKLGGPQVIDFVGPQL